MNILVPSKINRKIIHYTSQIKKNPILKYVPVLPEKYAIENECIPNVREKIKRDGGDIIYGWQLWETPIMLEAEYHAIWLSPDNKEIDVTPKILGINEILFFEDKENIYEGKQKNNIRINTTGNPIVDDYILLNDAIFKVLNKEDREYKRKIILKGNEAILYNYLKMIKDKLERYILSGATMSTICFCGRNKEYYRCHGNELKEIIKKI